MRTTQYRSIKKRRPVNNQKSSNKTLQTKSGIECRKMNNTPGLIYFPNKQFIVFWTTSNTTEQYLKAESWIEV